MQIDKIQGHRMTDIESQMSLIHESNGIIDALNEIGCTSFIMSKDEIEQMFKNGLLER